MDDLKEKLKEERQKNFNIEVKVRQELCNKFAEIIMKRDEKLA